MPRARPTKAPKALASVSTSEMPSRRRDPIEAKVPAHEFWPMVVLIQTRWCSRVGVNSRDGMRRRLATYGLQIRRGIIACLAVDHVLRTTLRTVCGHLTLFACVMLFLDSRSAAVVQAGDIASVRHRTRRHRQRRSTLSMPSTKRHAQGRGYQRRLSRPGIRAASSILKTSRVTALRLGFSFGQRQPSRRPSAVTRRLDRWRWAALAPAVVTGNDRHAGRHAFHGDAERIGSPRIRQTAGQASAGAWVSGIRPRWTRRVSFATRGSAGASISIGNADCRRSPRADPLECRARPGIRRPRRPRCECSSTATRKSRNRCDTRRATPCARDLPARWPACCRACGRRRRLAGLRRPSRSIPINSDSVDFLKRA